MSNAKLKNTMDPFSNQNSHKIGHDVLQIEAIALMELAKKLTEDIKDPFLKTIALLAALQGRVIVTGMGKSGHIGRKIAATLASTGTPAFFVHPAEASHGDMGMITEKDVVLALSNSGETAELTHLIHYCKRYNIPLIGITSNNTSTLAKASTCCLALPNAPEACPWGLAPTTSTTLMLALGDAIAVALLKQRNFSPQDYKLLHPGGNLGRRLLTAQDIMHTGDKLPLVTANTLMDEVLVLITQKGFGCAGVINAQNHLIGLITDGDLRRHMNPQLLSQPAEHIMTKNPLTILPTIFVEEIFHLISVRSVTSFFVLDDHKNILGLVHLHDCLRVGD